MNSSIVLHEVDGLALGNKGMYLVVFEQQYSIDVIRDGTMIFYYLPLLSWAKRALHSVLQPLLYISSEERGKRWESHGLHGTI